jgi:hypothetical protein
MTLEERIEKLEKLVNMILDNMSMRDSSGDAKDPRRHFKSFLEKEDKE